MNQGIPAADLANNPASGLDTGSATGVDTTGTDRGAGIDMIVDTSGSAAT